MTSLHLAAGAGTMLAPALAMSKTMAMTRISSARASNSLGSRLTALIGFQLRRTSTQSMTALEKSLADLQLRTVHYTVLAVIEESPGATQNQVSRTIGVKPANAVPIVNELMQRGLIERRPDANDRRAQHITLTPAAEALMIELHERVRAHEGRFLAPLDSGERAELMRLLLKLGTP